MEHSVHPSAWMILPFVILLATIALAPLFLAEWWQRHYPKVAYALGAVTLLYYLVGLKAYDRIWHTASEYVSFIVLIAALFVVSGGIHINVKGEATPLANVVFLFIGALVANLFGTTGAAMLLAMFYAVDYRNYLRAPRTVRARLAEPHDVWRFEGLSNLLFLGVILGA